MFRWQQLSVTPHVEEVQESRAAFDKSPSMKGSKGDGSKKERAKAPGRMVRLAAAG